MAKYTKPNSINTVWAVDALGADIEKPLDSYIQTGWTQIKPPYEYENWSMNKLHQGLAYYNQLGIPEWDGLTEYQALKSYVQATDGRIYRCIQTHTNKDPAAGNVNFWEVFEGNRQATTQAPGTVELATQNETDAGTRTDLVVTASGLHNKKATQTDEGIIRLATSAEVTAGTSTNTAVSPATLEFRTASTDQSGLVELASIAEARQGTRNDVALTPQSLAGVFEILLPVGSVTMRPTNPGLSISNGGLGFGTWTKISGRSIIGDGSYTDSNGENRNFVAGNSEGEFRHRLSVGEMPVHSHNASTSGAGSHKHTGTTANDGTHTHSGTAQNAGNHSHSGTAQNAGSHNHSGSMTEEGLHAHTGSTTSNGVHNHSGVTNTAGNHRHRQGGTDDDAVFGSWGSKGGVQNDSFGPNPYTDYAGDHNHGLSINNAGSHTHDLIVDLNGAHKHTLSIDNDGVHSHNLSINSNGTHNHTLSINSAGSHNHSFSTSTVGDHSHTVTVQNAGGNQRHNNIHPVFAAPIWYRTA